MNVTIILVILASLFVIVSVARSLSTAAKIKKMLAAGALVIDVRGAQEYGSGHFHGAVNIPYDQCEKRLPELGNDKARPIILYCHAGSRSVVAHEILRKNGFVNVVNARNYAAMKQFEKRP
jgi:phage shock protein E